MQRILKSSKNLKSIIPRVNLTKNIPVANFALKICDQVGYAAVDGSEAIARVAYACTETAFIYPITPSSQMGEKADEYMALQKKNLFDKVVQVNMLESEQGVAGAIHGSLAAGSVTTSFTTSQGLLLKIPNLYLIAGELLPCVINIASRVVGKHCQAIDCDHSDAYACRTLGWSMIFSTTVQEAQDLAFACYCATLEARVPFLHIIDGFKTSHQVNKIKLLEEEEMKKIYPFHLIQSNLRDYALTPHKPIMRGTGQRPDIFFQSLVANQPYYDKCPDIVEKWFNKIGDLTGRNYKLFQYYGDPKAEYVVIIMGSSAETAEEVVDYEMKNGKKVGCINVKLYRPWSAKHFLQSLPKTVKKICVLDRCKDEGTNGQPLYQDILTTVAEQIPEQKIRVIGGTYGICGKEFTPGMCLSVFENLYKEKPQNKFLVGINDDVNKNSLPKGKEIVTCDPETIQCVFWGVGSDGTIGANKAVIGNIALRTNLYSSGNFVYDAYKTDGVTYSALRFGPKPIKQQYIIDAGADFISCAFWKYCEKLDMCGPAKEGGIFLLNATWTKPEDFEQYCKPKMLRNIAQKNVKLYVIDSKKIAQGVGLGKRTNSIMATAFYYLSGVMPFETAEKMLRDDVINLYSKYGDKIVKSNMDSIDQTVKNLIKIDYPKEKWANFKDKPYVKPPADQPEYIEKIQTPILEWQANDLPVSVFEPGGYIKTTATTKYEKRGIGYNIPVWIPENCTQCNYCSLVCPHAIIRPYLLTKKEVEEAPKDMKIIKKAKGGSEMAPYSFTIQVSGINCTACEICAKACPDNALVMTDSQIALQQNVGHFDYCYNLPEKKNPLDKFTVKGSQFETPLIEFHGACAGCGETPYAKLMTQLFGKNLVIANATGCSMVWSAFVPSNPYTTDVNGRGPAYGHSLFEDGAQYGYGVVRSYQARVDNFTNELQRKLIPTFEKEYPEIAETLKQWNVDKKSLEKSEVHFEKVKAFLKNISQDKIKQDSCLSYLDTNKDLMTKKVFWIMGGDGWAYDIGFGGLDHIMTTKDDFNVLVLDTELYSNTGGQQSKATSYGVIQKFALDGKKTYKKDLGRVFMTYETAYVASVALGADMGQTVQTFKEAASYDGPSIVIAHCPCIDWKNDTMGKNFLDQKTAVEAGYWPLYRYDPRKEFPFQLDNKTLKKDITEYLATQVRFSKFKKNEDLVSAMREFVNAKHNRYKRMSMNDFDLMGHLKKKFEK